MNDRPHQAILIADLGYGDAGKGTLVDSIVRECGAHAVIRYNGGSQAAHNVVLPDGRHHTFSQFGSASFVPGVVTYLSRYMLINPIGMMIENDLLRQVGVSDAFGRTLIDENALVITPFHCAANRIIEHMRGDARHGSCGQGVGQTAADALIEGGRYAIRAKDLLDPDLFARKLLEIRRLKQIQLRGRQFSAENSDLVKSEIETIFGTRSIDRFMPPFRRFREVANIVPSSRLEGILSRGTVVFEGAQGVLLDQDHGFHPHVTSTNITFENALSLLSGASFRGETVRIGVARAYMTRHGAGPFVTESRELSDILSDDYNTMHPWQQAFRFGWPDLVALHYSIEALGGIDILAVTNVDRLATVKIPWMACYSYDVVVPPGADPDSLFETDDIWSQPAARKYVANRIKPRARNVEARTHLTKCMWDAQPRYAPVGHSDPMRFAEEMANELGVPLGIVSAGPTFQDKRFLPMWSDSLGLAAAKVS